MLRKLLIWLLLVPLPNEKGKIFLSADAFNLFNFHDLWMASSQTYGSVNFLKLKDSSVANFVTASTAQN